MDSALKIQLIRSGIEGAARVWADPDLFLYPFTDYLLTAFQRPLCISVWQEGKKDKLLFTSFNDPEIIKNVKTGNHLRPFEPDNKIPVPGCAGLFMTVHRIADDRFVIFSEDTRFLTELLASFNEIVWRQFKAGVVRFSFDKQNHPIDLSLAEPLTTGQVNGFLKYLRPVLDEVYEDLRYSDFLHIESAGGSKIFNLFTVLRTVRSPEKRYGHFPYTASLFLAPSQKKEFESLCSSNTPLDKACRLLDRDRGGCIDLLEEPMGIDSRSIFDSVTSAGFIDFGTPGSKGEAGSGRRDICGAGPRDQERAAIEKCIYGEITRQKQSQMSYMPIHIGGSPWLALFSFTPIESAAKAWEQNYNLYRDVIAKVSDRMRRGAQFAYLNALADVMITHDYRAPDYTEQVNHSWQLAAQVYPFERCRLVRNPPDAPTTENGNHRIVFPGGVTFHLEFEENRYFPQQVKIGRFTHDRITDHLRLQLSDLHIVENEAKAKVINGLMAQSHTIFNRMPLQELECAKIEGEDTGRWVSDAYKKTEILEIAFSIALVRDVSKRLPSSLTALINWLASHTLFSEPMAQIEKTESFGDIQFSSKDVASVFNVLWNLWHNASRASVAQGSKDFSIKLDASGTHTLITFSNKGAMPAMWLNFLRSPATTPPEEGRKGLGILKTDLNNLGWRLIDATSGDSTSITIGIPVRKE